MKRSIGFSLVFMTLLGCSTTPTEPVQPEGRSRVALNNPATVAQTMADYYRAQVEQKAKAAPPRVTQRMTVAEVVERFLPADYRVYAAQGVDLDTFVDYETSRPTFEAIGKALSDVGIEMTANLEQKTMMLRLGITTIEQALNRIIPADYTVYVDEAVRLNVPVKVDRTKPWVEGLGKALATAGVAMTAYVDKKMVVLKPRSMSRSRIVRFKDDGELTSLPVAPQSYSYAGERDGIRAANSSHN